MNTQFPGITNTHFTDEETEVKRQCGLKGHPAALRASLCPYQLGDLGRAASSLSLRFFTCKRRTMSPPPPPPSPRLGKWGPGHRWQVPGRVPSAWWVCGRRKAPGGGFGLGPRAQPRRPEAGLEPRAISPRVPSPPDQVLYASITQKPSPSLPPPPWTRPASNRDAGGRRAALGRPQTSSCRNLVQLRGCAISQRNKPHPHHR